MDPVIKAWKKASTDLKISVVSPFILKTNSGDIEFPLLILDFGLEKGTIILDIDDFRDFSEIPKEHGYYCSGLNPESYSKYDREHFIDTLEDWGYYGNPKNKPIWYTGKYYQRNNPVHK